MDKLNSKKPNKPWNDKQDRLAKQCRQLATRLRAEGNEAKAKHYEAEALKCESFKIV